MLVHKRDGKRTYRPRLLELDMPALQYSIPGGHIALQVRAQCPAC